MMALLSLGQTAAALWGQIIADFGNLGSPSALSAFLQVLAIDVMLAGDNAIVVGALAAGLPADQRRRVILIGIGAALVLRVVFALVVTQLLQLVGLVFAGGLLLLWVSWKFWRELRDDPAQEADDASPLRPARSFASAAWAVAVADVSMSLDNVLAVAGAAREHPGILMIGLLLSVVLMGIAANLIAQLIGKHRWIGYIGLVVILYVAGRMIYDGWVDPQVGIGQLLG